jgi:crotonobetainyl-CoA:carnitine CoA-transferase CaiB-like acyl-CoA transferase
LAIAANNDRQFIDLCRGIDRPELATDARFAAVTDRQSNAEEFRLLLQGELKSRSAQEWEAILDPLGVPASRVRALDELVAEGQPTARGLLTDVDVGGHSVRLPTAGVKINAEVPGPVDGPPVLGADNDRILSDIGYDDEAIADLRARGTI